MMEKELEQKVEGQLGEVWEKKNRKGHQLEGLSEELIELDEEQE